jgi:hypothetical protein
MSKEDKKVPVDNQEDFILKKIRYYQGTIDDYETFWNKKAAEGEKEECPETKSFQKRNAELNKAFEIIPVEKDETVMCTDVASDEKGNDGSEPKKEEKEEKKEEKKEKVEEPKKKEKDDDDDDDDDDKEEKDDDDDDDDKKKKHKEDD